MESPVPTTCHETLGMLTVQSSIPSNILYFKITDRPVVEYEQLLTFRLPFYNRYHQLVKIFDVTVPAPSTIGDLLAELKLPIHIPGVTGVPFLVEGPSAQLQMLDEFHGGQFYCRPVDPRRPVGDLLPTSPCLVNPVVEEVLPRAPLDPQTERLLKVCHIDNVTPGAGFLTGYHGHSFSIVAHKFDTMGDLRLKVRAELGPAVTDKEFAQWRLLKVGYGNVRVLGESEPAGALEWHPNFHLGLEHEKIGRVRVTTAGGLTRRPERAVVIRG
ncbi:hypothetical protein PAPYR_10742 [Paratrimastix pyriformis]|uniref:ubiquitinyl hydrolase 1 n=1 Tax=Paratrimastix pyriformis TaxID=342808 RepID=A0ABQ8UB21_9EUKA|nr:hypothetical protein PAPYR_10742 [Paratrimastix pyriformis]